MINSNQFDFPHGPDNIGYSSYIDENPARGHGVHSYSDNIVAQRTARGLYQSPEDSGQYDDVVTQRSARGLYQCPEDSGQYDDVDTQRSRATWLYQSPGNSCSVNVSSQKSVRVSKQSPLDSGKYEEIESQTEGNRAIQIPQPRLTNSQEPHSLRRHVYEFEYSGSLSRTYERSYAEVNHYEEVVSHDIY